MNDALARAGILAIAVCIVLVFITLIFWVLMKIVVITAFLLPIAFLVFIGALIWYACHWAYHKIVK